MTVLTAAGTEVDGAGRDVAPLVRETYWGYEIREHAGHRDQETAMEAFLRFLGLVLVLAAYAQWLLPAGLFGEDANTARAGLTFAFGAGGAAIYWFANRGLTNSVQVDLSRRELRLVARNARNQLRLRRRLPMEDVQSAFLRRSKEPGHDAELCLRLMGGAELLLAQGPEAEMAALHRRMCLDLRPVEARLRDKLTERPLFISSRYVGG
jgi:hypothetical protein